MILPISALLSVGVVGYLVIATLTHRFWDAWEWFRTEKEGDNCSPKMRNPQLLGSLWWLSSPPI
jgi:hypothetical protein